jgi:hypothetical protein
MKTHLARRAMLVNNKYVSRTLLKMMFQLANKIEFVFLAMTVLIFSCQTVARMPVPKMVKNGFNSVLQTSAGSRRLVAQGIQEQIRRPKTALKS